MKNIYLILALLFSSFTFAVTDLEIPLEMNSFQVEFREASQTGIIRVNGCDRCKNKFYKFDKGIIITREGKVVNLDVLLSEYWEVEYPTVFLKLDGTKAIRISY